MQKKDFVSLAEARPDLAAEWNYEKNGNLRPEDVTCKSGKKIWWKLPYDVPIDYNVEKLSGKHFEFEWKAAIRNRSNRAGCPYLSGRMAWPGFNDLETVNPELAKQWHPTKNGNLKPQQVTCGSKQKVWWFYPYDDSNSGKHFDFEWQAPVYSRVNGNSCPYLSGRAVWPGFNDLQTVNPKLASQWHPTKNGNLKPTEVTANSGKKVWWLLHYEDGKTKQCFNFEWKTDVKSRNKGSNCPYLTIYKGEEYIKQYLQKNNIVFIPQQKFPDLIGTGGGQLSYDFSIPSKKYGFVLIEYNGIQHYESSEFFGGEEKFKKQKEHDRLKKEYAKKHGYKLIIVKYTYDTYEDVAEYLEKELKKSDESVFDSESKTRLHQTSNGDFSSFVNEMNGEDIKTAEKEVIKESTEENNENIGKIEEKTGENIVYNKEENVA